MTAKTNGCNLKNGQRENGEAMDRQQQHKRRKMILMTHTHAWHCDVDWN